MFIFITPWHEILYYEYVLYLLHLFTETNCLVKNEFMQILKAHILSYIEHLFH